MKEGEKEIIYWLLGPDNPSANFGMGLTTARQQLKNLGLKKIYEEIEMPLSGILLKMRERGVALDGAFLRRTKNNLAQKTENLKNEVYKLSGREFNLNSPKQLLAVLFDDLKIVPRLKSTAAEQLALIKDRHPVIQPILDYRENFKLLNTYIEPLLKIGDAARTTFLQTGTATGRLSSQNPNLQNVPDVVRPAFVARSGHQLVSVDYSQIELRVLASVAQDLKMIGAFKNGLDIHQLTASQVFNVPLEKVTGEMRQLAKTLNFGVIYGMGAAAFARTSGLPIKEARKFIEEYFQDFAQIKEWQEKIIKETKIRGYVENLNGRKRWLPAINSQDQKIASEAARAAINMPIQSLAADIIKLAMIKISEKKLSGCHLLLSIHDELLFEIEGDKVKESVAEIKKIMENAYRLSVPLKVNIKVGENWGDLT